MSVNLGNGDECAHCGEQCIVVSAAMRREDWRLPKQVFRFADSGCGPVDSLGKHYARNGVGQARYAKCVCPRCGSPYWGCVTPAIWNESGDWDIRDMCHRQSINDEPGPLDGPIRPVERDYDKLHAAAMAFESVHQSRSI
jgi:hypothetical protein